MMFEKNMRWARRMLAGSFVMAAVVSGGGWHVAVAQEEDAAMVKESSSQEQVQREGVWVDIFFGTGVDKETRSVIGEATTFPTDGDRVYCLTRVHGMSPPTTVTHAWYHESKTMARVDLPVGSENWRTWSYKTYLPAWTGSWEVKVLNEDGMVLGTAGFEVK
jgi:hypothetical protein